LGASASAINFDQTLAPSHPSCLMRALCTACNRRICHECFNNHNCTIKNDVDMIKAAGGDHSNQNLDTNKVGNEVVKEYLKGGKREKDLFKIQRQAEE
jgi:hypothetical protein